MDWAEEVQQAVAGVFRLFRFDPRAIASFGRDLPAARRSFWAWAFAVPALTIALWIDVDDAKLDDAGAYAAAKLIAQVIDIAGFPLVLLAISELWGRRDRWPLLVYGYNWYSALQITLQITVLSLALGSPIGLVRIAMLGIWVYTLVVEAFLIQTTLGVGRLKGLFVVLLDVAFGIALDNAARGVAGLPFRLL